MDVSLTDGQAHDIALYAVDWDNQGRSEQIQITSAATGAVLDTETLSHFTGGVYLQWELSGNVVITFKTLAGPNAVLSGLFFDPPSTSNAAAVSQVTPDVTVPGSLKSNTTNVAANTTAAFGDPADSLVILNVNSASSTSSALVDATENSWITPIIDVVNGPPQAVDLLWSIHGTSRSGLKPPGFRRSVVDLR